MSDEIDLFEESPTHTKYLSFLLQGEQDMFVLKEGEWQES